MDPLMGSAALLSDHVAGRNETVEGSIRSRGAGYSRAVFHLFDA
jgi:hypothetical protein